MTSIAHTKANNNSNSLESARSLIIEEKVLVWNEGFNGFFYAHSWLLVRTIWSFNWSMFRPSVIVGTGTPDSVGKSWGHVRSQSPYKDILVPTIRSTSPTGRSSRQKATTDATAKPCFESALLNYRSEFETTNIKIPNYNNIPLFQVFFVVISLNIRENNEDPQSRCILPTKSLPNRIKQWSIGQIDSNESSIC